MKRWTIAALIVVLAGLAAWLARRGEERGSPAPFVAPAEPARATPGAAPALVAPRAASGVHDEPSAAVPAGERRAAVADAPPVTGSVRLSAPLPADAEVLVAAAFDGASVRELTARMARDGSFALAVPTRATDVRLGLRSPHLFLEAPVHVVPGQSGVVLEPEVLAVVAGVVVAPPAWPGAEWAQLQVRWRLAPGVAVDLDRAQRAELLARRAPFVWPRDGRFELPHVAPGVDLELGVTSLFGPETTLALAPLAPGERREVRVELVRGITVSGRVVDERGEPVEGATIRTDVPLADVPAPTDADGRFELTRLHARPMRISTGPYGLLHGAEATVDATYGDVSDVVLAVVRGRPSVCTGGRTSSELVAPAARVGPRPSVCTGGGVSVAAGARGSGSGLAASMQARHGPLARST
jgi:hypothetical protein